MSLEKRPTLIKLNENRKYKELRQKVNEVMFTMYLEDLNLDEINIYHFGCALFIQRKVAPWFDEDKKHRKRFQEKTPLWKKKINKRISLLRAEISYMTTKEPATKNLLNRIRRLKRKYNISQEHFNARIAEHTAQLKAL